MRLFIEAASPIWAPAKDPIAQRRSAKPAGFDGLIVVTPEYNHGPSAALRNALNYAYKEFIRKPVRFVGYGDVGVAHAVEQLRLIAIELQIAPCISGWSNSSASCSKARRSTTFRTSCNPPTRCSMTSLGGVTAEDKSRNYGCHWGYELHGMNQMAWMCNDQRHRWTPTSIIGSVSYADRLEQHRR